MAYPESYYHNPEYAVEDHRRLEIYAERKAARKARRDVYGCQCCARYRHDLKACSEGQGPNRGHINQAHWCKWHWDDRSTKPAPEISRNG